MQYPKLIHVWQYSPTQLQLIFESQLAVFVVLKLHVLVPSNAGFSQEDARFFLNQHFLFFPETVIEGVVEHTRLEVGFYTDEPCVWTTQGCVVCSAQP